MLYGTNIGRAGIVFTDYYIRSDKGSVLRLIVFLMAGIFLVTGAIIIIISHIITNPVQKLADIVRDMAEGDADLSRRIPVKGKDELSRLSKYFNTFLDKLKTIVLSLKKVGSTSKNVSTELEQSSQLVSSSPEGITCSIKDMSKRMGILNDEIMNSNDNIRQIHSFIANVVEMIREQADNRITDSAYQDNRRSKNFGRRRDEGRNSPD